MCEYDAALEPVLVSVAGVGYDPIGHSIRVCVGELVATTGAQLGEVLAVGVGPLVGVVLVVAWVGCHQVTSTVIVMPAS